MKPAQYTLSGLHRIDPKLKASPLPDRKEELGRSGDKRAMSQVRTEKAEGFG